MHAPSKLPKPPALAVWLLKRFFPDEIGIYTQLGDLEEAFHKISQEKSNLSAEIMTWALTRKTWWSLTSRREIVQKVRGC